MKKYIKPILDIETFELSNNVASSISGTVEAKTYQNDAGSLNWETLFPTTTEE